MEDRCVGGFYEDVWQKGVDFQGRGKSRHEKSGGCINSGRSVTIETLGESCSPTATGSLKLPSAAFAIKLELHSSTQISWTDLETFGRFGTAFFIIRTI